MHEGRIIQDDEAIAAAIRRECPNVMDEEASHFRADEILCELLERLGYVETVKAWKAVDKWYA